MQGVTNENNHRNRCWSERKRHRKIFPKWSEIAESMGEKCRICPYWTIQGGGIFANWRENQGGQSKKWLPHSYAAGLMRW